MKKRIFKLYTAGHEYKCKLTPAEVVFLFGIPEDITEPGTINNLIKKHGYYIKEATK